MQLFVKLISKISSLYYKTPFKTLFFLTASVIYDNFECMKTIEAYGAYVFFNNNSHKFTAHALKIFDQCNIFHLS